MIVRAKPKHPEIVQLSVLLRSGRLDAGLHGSFHQNVLRLRAPETESKFWVLAVRVYPLRPAFLGCTGAGLGASS